MVHAVISMLLLMTLLAVTLFGVPMRGSFATLALAALIFVLFSTGFGLFASTFTRSQIAAMFVAMISTMLLAAPVIVVLSIILLKKQDS